MFFEPAQVRLLDTWHVAGLRGTGSTDYEVHDAVVPEGRWAQIGATPPRVDGPLYRFSFFGMLALGVASVALGLGRRGLDELVALAGGKVPQGSRRVLAERAPMQAEVAGAEATVRSAARARRRDRRRRAGRRCWRGDPVSDEQRRSLRLAATHATISAAAATSACYTAGGGAAIYEAARSSGSSATCTSPPSTPWSLPARSNRSAASASGWRPTPASSDPQSLLITDHAPTGHIGVRRQPGSDTITSVRAIGVRRADVSRRTRRRRGGG